MTLEIDIEWEHELDDFSKYLKMDLRRAYTRGFKKGLNRAARGARTEADKQIRAEFNFKRGGKKRVFQDVKKPQSAVGSNINTMKAVLPVSSDRGVNLIRFATQARIQKNPGRGKAPRVKVRKGRGRYRHMKNSFIQVGAGGNKMIFRNPRKGERKKVAKGGRSYTSEVRVIGQMAKSVALMLQDDKVWPKFQKGVRERMQKEITKGISHEIDKVTK